MKIALKLPIDFKDNVEEISNQLELEVKTNTFKSWVNAEIEYTISDINKTANLVTELLKTALESVDSIGTRVNGIQFKVTKDNENNLQEILKKLMV